MLSGLRMLRPLSSAAPSLAARSIRSTRSMSSVPSGGIYNEWGKAFNMGEFILKSDQSSLGLKVYHKLNFALIGLGPLALMLSPSSMNMPIDLLLGVIIPVHGHIGGNDLISDYAKKITKAKSFEMGLRGTLLGVTIVTFLGLTKLNIDGPGVTESFKSVWRPRKE